MVLLACKSKPEPPVGGGSALHDTRVVDASPPPDAQERAAELFIVQARLLVGP